VSLLHHLVALVEQFEVALHHAAVSAAGAPDVGDGQPKRIVSPMNIGAVNVQSRMPSMAIAEPLKQACAVQQAGQHG